MADPTSVVLGKCEIGASFNPAHKSSMKSVLVEGVKKGINDSGDFKVVTSAPPKDATSFMVTVNGVITKNDKSKPPSVKVVLSAQGLISGQKTSGQQFKTESNALTELTNKPDEDVKFALQAAIKALTKKDGNKNLISGMRQLMP